MGRGLRPDADVCSHRMTVAVVSLKLQIWDSAEAQLRVIPTEKSAACLQPTVLA